jgi:N-acetylglucosamine kinase-like BadF-type ATPase
VTAAVLAIDGGNSKTDVALIDEDGTLLGHARGPGSCHQSIGVDATMRVLGDLVRDAATDAGFDPRAAVARHGAIYLAGADYPAEVRMLRSRAKSAGWAGVVEVDNDTFALLRAGTASADAVAVVCGAGINCVGRSAAGGSVRFPSLGAISGDWGGGAALGTEALFLAVRAEDGRGRRTALRDAVREHFGTASVADVTAAFHFGELAWTRIHELAPVLFHVAQAGDSLAGEVVERLAEEVFQLASVALRRLRLIDEPADVVLGGGVLAARHPQLLGSIEKMTSAVAPSAQLRVVDDPPVVGAALLGLDTVGASSAAEKRVRAALLSRIWDRRGSGAESSPV